MNIYIIPAWYPLNDKDVTASFIREQAHALSKRGHNITVVFIKNFNIRDIKGYVTFKKHFWNDGGIKTYYFKTISFFPSRFEKLFHKIISNKYLRILKKVISKDRAKPDLIHTHVGPWCSYFAIPAAKKLGLPVITTEHYSGLTNGQKGDLKFLREKYVIDNSDLTIFVGSNFQKFVLKMTGSFGKTTVIPNSIDESKFQHLCDKTSSKFIFLTACRLIPLKKVELVIDAFHEEFKNDDNVEYVIAGDGPLMNNLKEKIANLGEQGRIKLVGSYSRDEMPKLFSACDCFVLTSQFETFGIVYLEAMMCGLPCIATKGQGGEDIINDSNGLLVEYNNFDELRKAMRHLANNACEYNKKEIINSTANVFGDDRICSILEEKYNEVLQK